MSELKISEEKNILQNEISMWFDKIKQHIELIPDELTEQIELLSEIRKNLYENINQLQHVALIIKVAEQLQKKYPEINKWSWHPKQTSDPRNADLTGYVNGQVFLNAEVTTSLKPIGTIDQRMKETLKSLNGKQGKKYYFVLTDEMFSRAKTKKEKSNFDIVIEKI